MTAPGHYKTMNEQRRHSRLAIEIPVEWGQQHLSSVAVIADLSEEGVCLRVPKEEKPVVGTPIQLKVSLITSHSGYWIFTDPGAYVASIPREHTTYVRGQVTNVREEPEGCLLGIHLFDDPEGYSLGLIREYVTENS